MTNVTILWACNTCDINIPCYFIMPEDIEDLCPNICPCTDADDGLLTYKHPETKWVPLKEITIPDLP